MHESHSFATDSLHLLQILQSPQSPLFATEFVANGEISRQFATDWEI